MGILARVLTPREFGLFGLVAAVHMLFRPILDMGLIPAYLKLENSKEDAQSAFFTINLLIGVLASLSFVVLSPIAAFFYKEPRLCPVLMVFAVSLLFTSLSAQPRASLARAKKFGRIAAVQSSSTLLGSSAAVSLAFAGAGVWALVARALVETGLKAMSLLLLSQKTFRIVSWQRMAIYSQSLWFGIRIVLNRIVGMVGFSLDRIVLAGFVPLSDLGFYTRTQSLAAMPDSHIRTSLTTPALAYLARIKGGAKPQHYIALQWLVLFVAGFPCLVLVIEGEHLIPWYLGKQWIQAGELSKWIGIWGIGKLFHGIGFIIHLNTKKMINWLFVSLLSIPATLAYPVIQLFKEEGVYTFAIWFSITFFLFWTIAYFGSLIVYFPHKRRSVILCMKQAAFIFFVVGMGLRLSPFLECMIQSPQASLPLNLALTAIFLALTILVYLGLFARNDIRLIARYLRK